MDKLYPYLNHLKDHKRLIKTATIVIIAIVAVAVFGHYGENDETQILLTEENQGFAQSFDEGKNGDKSAENPGAEEHADIEIYVDIGGMVKKPGVYKVNEGTRLFEVIEQAGGLSQGASLANINQAKVVIDGEKIVIPSEEEVKAGAVSGFGDISGFGKGEGTGAPSGQQGQTFTFDGRVNINTADRQGLQEIPGVGPVTADKIIAYRSSNGPFKSTEELKNVSGIGEKTFQKIKDMVGI